MGASYRAHDVRLERDVALTILLELCCRREPPQTCRDRWARAQATWPAFLKIAALVDGLGEGLEKAVYGRAPFRAGRPNPEARRSASDAWSVNVPSH